MPCPGYSMLLSVVIAAFSMAWGGHAKSDNLHPSSLTWGAHLVKIRGKSRGGPPAFALFSSPVLQLLGIQNHHYCCDKES